MTSTPIQNHDYTGYLCGCDENTAEGWSSSRAKWPRKTHPRWMVIVDCCERRVHLHETEAHLSIAYGGYAADWRFRCAPDKGCNVNPNYKRTAHLRSYDRG